MNQQKNQTSLPSQSYQKGWQQSLKNFDVFVKPSITTQKSRPRRPQGAMQFRQKQ
jgi:hypothetical protein